MANNLWIQNNPHAAAMDSKTFRNSGIRQQGKRLVYWPKEVICLPAVDPYRFWNFVVGRAAAVAAAGSIEMILVPALGFMLIMTAAASKIFSLAIRVRLRERNNINRLAKPFFKDFSRENWVEHMFFHKDTLTHIFKDDEMDSFFFFLCGCLMDSPYNHMLFQQICVDIIGGVLLVPNIGVGFFSWNHFYLANFVFIW